MSRLLLIDYSSVSEDRGEPTTEIKNLTIRIAEKEKKRNAEMADLLRWKIVIDC